MGNSAIGTPTFQATIGNIKNADGITPIYAAGAYTFNNASAVTTFAVDASGAVAIGPSSSYQPVSMLAGKMTYAADVNSNYMQYNSTGAVSGNFVESKTATRIRLTGTNSTNNDSISFQTTPAVGTAGAAIGWTEVAKCTSGGIWTFGISGDGGVQTFNGQIAPNVDNSYTCGTSAKRWTVVYAINGSIQTSSDSRLKTNIIPMTSMLDKILMLKPSTWESKYTDYPVGTSGFIAQDVELIFPEFVKTENEPIQGIDNLKTLSMNGLAMIAVLVKGIQELSAKNDALEARLAALEAK